jgi:hypothetical protein
MVDVTRAAMAASSVAPQLALPGAGRAPRDHSLAAVADEHPIDFDVDFSPLSQPGDLVSSALVSS